MLPIRTAVTRSLRRLRISEASRQPTRLAHGDHGAHGTSHTQPLTESFGRSFYLVLALIPSAALLYNLRPTDQASRDSNALTNIIKSWKEAKEDIARRNALHTKLVEQAGFDKNLYVNARVTNHIELRFPEQFNAGSPYNVPAGHGPANFDKLVAYYQEKSYADEEAKIQKLQDQHEETEVTKRSSS